MAGLLGTDTFRGTANSTLMRTALYNKNGGDIDVHKSGLLRLESPISGNLLVSTASAQQKLRDPISGTNLRYAGGHAVVTTHAMKQELVCSRKFYVTKDVDITIQTLRNTTKVSRYTNEKVGTAGTPTGLTGLDTSAAPARR